MEFAKALISFTKQLSLHICRSVSYLYGPVFWSVSWHFSFCSSIPWHTSEQCLKPIHFAHPFLISGSHMDLNKKYMSLMDRSRFSNKPKELSSRFSNKHKELSADQHAPKHWVKAKYPNNENIETAAAQRDSWTDKHWNRVRCTWIWWPHLLSVRLQRC